MNKYIEVYLRGGDVLWECVADYVRPWWSLIFILSVKSVLLEISNRSLVNI